MSINLKDLEVGFKITSINEVSRTCNVTITFRHVDGDGERSRNMNEITISRLLMWRLLSKDDKTVELGKDYSCPIDSDNRREGPLQLLRMNCDFERNDGNTEMYMLALVIERQALRIETEDPFGNKLVEYINRYHTKDNYRRYRDVRKVRS